MSTKCIYHSYISFSSNNPFNFSSQNDTKIFKIISDLQVVNIFIKFILCIFLFINVLYCYFLVGILYHYTSWDFINYILANSVLSNSFVN